MHTFKNAQQAAAALLTARVNIGEGTQRSTDVDIEAGFLSAFATRGLRESLPFFDATLGQDPRVFAGRTNQHNFNAASNSSPDNPTRGDLANRLDLFRRLFGFVELVCHRPNLSASTRLFAPERASLPDHERTNRYRPC